jgi:hypothetical protein
MGFRLFLAVLAACFSISFEAGAADAIGKVSRLQGMATRTAAGARSDLKDGAQLYLLDAIETGADARVEITLEDLTIVTLGEKAKLTLDAFVYAPAGQNRMGMSVAGPFRFLSGKMPKGANTTMTVTTPAATIGIRGTHFWGGPVSGNYGVILFEGEITVTTTAGEVAISRPLDGVDITGAALGPVTPWAQPKIDQAVGTVTFR